MTIVSNLDLIRRIPLFSSLTDAHAQRLADRVIKRRFKRGEIVVQRGQRSNALFILLAGRACVLMADARGREVIVGILHAGDYVGEMSLIDSEPHSATVRAEVQTDVLVLDQAEFARCFPANFNITYAVMHGLVQRLRRANKQIESLALFDVTGRVERTLDEMAKVKGDHGQIHNKVSRQNLAKVVGASRESVSRAIRDLERCGRIQTQKNGSIVINQEVDGPALTPTRADTAR